MKMAFIESISNEEVAALQAVQFDGEIVLVETPQALEEACTYLAAQKIIGFDTETRPSFTAGVTNKVALLQLYGGEKCFLIRLNRVQMTKQLTDILHRSDIIKVGAAVKNDIIGLAKLRHFTAGGFIDLQDIVCTDNCSDSVSFMILDNIGLGGDSYYWVNWYEGEDGAESCWVNSDFEKVSGMTIQPGQGLWVAGDSEEPSITFPGVEL